MSALDISPAEVTSVDRFKDPLYTLTEAARYLSVPPTTFSKWANGYERRLSSGQKVVGEPIVTVVGDSRKWGRQYEPLVPFIGLAEGLVLAAIRQRGIPLQRISPALTILADELGLDHALASRALYTEGAEILYEYAKRRGDTPEARSARRLIVVRNGHGMFNAVVQDYLHLITYGPDDYAQVIQLPQYESATILADPRRSFGQPIFSHGGTRVEDALQLFWAGEELHVVAEEFGVPEVELEDAVRVASRRAA